MCQVQTCLPSGFITRGKRWLYTEVHVGNSLGVLRAPRVKVQRGMVMTSLNKQVYTKE